MFGEEAGFFALAAIMMILGVAVLGNLNTEAMSQELIGLAFWRIIISAGILAMVVSLVNILAVSQIPKPFSSTRCMLIITDLHLHRPHPGPQCPPRPTIRGCGPAKGGESGQQQSVIPA